LCSYLANNFSQRGLRPWRAVATSMVCCLSFQGGYKILGKLMNARTFPFDRSKGSIATHQQT
jgi:hypothetical protein